MDGISLQKDSHELLVVQQLIQLFKGLQLIVVEL